MSKANKYYCHDCDTAQETDICVECENACDEICGHCGKVLDNCECEEE
jgi:hypothetical protein